MAGELGFSCIQLPSKVLYASMGIDRGGLTRELADHLRAVLDEAGVSVAGYVNITPRILFGVSYKPTFLQFGNPEPWRYEHTIAIELKFYLLR